MKIKKILTSEGVKYFCGNVEICEEEYGKLVGVGVTRMHGGMEEGDVILSEDNIGKIKNCMNELQIKNVDNYVFENRNLNDIKSKLDTLNYKYVYFEGPDCLQIKSPLPPPYPTPNDFNVLAYPSDHNDEERFLYMDNYPLDPAYEGTYFNQTKEIIPDDGNCHITVYAIILNKSIKELRNTIANHISDKELKGYIRTNIVINHVLKDNTKSALIDMITVQFTPSYSVLKNIKLYDDADEEYITNKIENHTVYKNQSEIAELFNDDNLFKEYIYTDDSLKNCKELIRKFENNDRVGILYSDVYWYKYIINEYKSHLINIILIKDPAGDNYNGIQIERVISDEQINPEEIKYEYMFTESTSGHINLLYPESYIWEDIPLNMMQILKNINKSNNTKHEEYEKKILNYMSYFEESKYNAIKILKELNWEFDL